MPQPERSADAPVTPPHDDLDGHLDALFDAILDAAERRAAPPLLLARTEAAAAAGVGVTTWDRLDASGKTPKAVRVGGRKLYRTADLQEWVRLGCPDRREFEARTA